MKLCTLWRMLLSDITKNLIWSLSDLLSPTPRCTRKSGVLLWGAVAKLVKAATNTFRKFGHYFRPFYSIPKKATCAYTLSEIITIGIIATVLVVGGIIACVVSIYSHRLSEALKPLLEDTSMLLSGWPQIWQITVRGLSWKPFFSRQPTTCSCICFTFYICPLQNKVLNSLYACVSVINC